jgi:diamine N-acetyltransferase
MLVQTKNNKKLFLRRLAASDFNELLYYLQHLSDTTKNRFGPHPFNPQSLIDFYQDIDLHLGYIAIDTATNKIIAYCIVKRGYLGHDINRLQSYGIVLNHKTDCTFAPSVADDWQSCGVGNHLFQFITADLKNAGINRLILWGGVQASNEKAVNYYKRNGFKTLGQFNHNGENYDMVFEIT